jgi:hypothetical protein
MAIALTYGNTNMASTVCVVWGGHVWVNFVPKVVGMVMGLQY